MMTRNEYSDLANWLRENRRPEITPEYDSGFDDAVQALVEFLARTDKRFDQKRFESVVYAK